MQSVSDAWKRQPQSDSRIPAGFGQAAPRLRGSATRFGSGSELKTDTVNLTTKQPDDTKPAADKRWFGDKSRLMAGFLLEDVLPPMMGFAFLAGPMGWVVTLGSLPMSYAAGKLGRHISKDVKKDNLPKSMQSFHDFREGFRNRDKLQSSTELINKWNVFVDDALNVQSGKYRWLAGLVGNKLNVRTNSKMGRFLSSPQFLKAGIYHDVARSNSVGQAIKSSAKGGFSFWLYNTALPGAGLAMEKISSKLWGPFKLPFQGIGWMLKNLALLKLGKDIMFSSEGKTQARPST